MIGMADAGWGLRDFLLGEPLRARVGCSVH
jgi:hypothetical protein